MDRTFYPTIVNERDDPEYNDSLPETEPYNPYLDDPRRATYHDLQRLSAIMKKLEDAVEAALAKLRSLLNEQDQESQERGTPALAAYISSLRCIEDALQGMLRDSQACRAGDDEWTVQNLLAYLRCTRRPGLHHLRGIITSRPFYRARQVLRTGLETLRVLKDGRMKLARGFRGYEETRQAWINELTLLHDTSDRGHSIYSLEDKIMSGLSAAYMWKRFRAEEESQARQEWEEAQLMKLWPVS